MTIRNKHEIITREEIAQYIEDREMYYIPNSDRREEFYDLIDTFLNKTCIDIWFIINDRPKDSTRNELFNNENNKFCNDVRGFIERVLSNEKAKVCETNINYEIKECLMYEFKCKDKIKPGPTIMDGYIIHSCHRINPYRLKYDPNVSDEVIFEEVMNGIRDDFIKGMIDEDRHFSFHKIENLIFEIEAEVSVTTTSYTRTSILSKIDITN